MGVLWLGVLAIGPGLCLTHAIWARDREREPRGNLTVYFALGVVAVIPAALGEGLLSALLHPEGSLLLLPLWVFFGIALMEEGAKRFLLLARSRNDHHVDEPFDWVVYSVAIALGFATLENVLYVYQQGAGVGVLRAFTAVPAHALNGTMMGWRLARASKLEGDAARRERRWSLWEPVAWHAAYDAPLLAQEQGVAPCLFLVLWLAVLISQWRICASRIGQMTREQHLRPPPLLAVDRMMGRFRRRGSG